MATVHDLKLLRIKMVEEQIKRRGISSQSVIDAMLSIPRHKFVTSSKPRMAYRDSPLPIGQGQTISQPYIIAYMTELLDLHPDDKVLEVGTGSGYQAAILSQICRQVFTIEIIAEHCSRATKLFEELNYSNIHLRMADGRLGWAEEAPFDKIMVTAAANKIVPELLLDQLADSGRMVIPVGRDGRKQDIILCERQGKKIVQTKDLPVRFVPLVQSGKSLAPGSG
ncbi:protein-L-isoaspartate(D-aspartate) O-methyltransferase [Candidatus Neomarinimicrobiota bacterium]